MWGKLGPLGQVENESGSRFFSIVEGADVVSGGDQGGLSAVAGTEIGLRGVMKIVSFQVFGELLVDGLL